MSDELFSSWILNKLGAHQIQFCSRTTKLLRRSPVIYQQFLGWALLAGSPAFAELSCPLPISLTGLCFYLEFRRRCRNKQLGACVQHHTHACFYFLLAWSSVALLILFSWELHAEKKGHAKKKWFLTWLRDSLLLIWVCTLEQGSDCFPLGTHVLWIQRPGYIW